MDESLTAPEEHLSWKLFLTKKRYLPKWLIASIKWFFLGLLALCALLAIVNYLFGLQFRTLRLVRGVDMSIVPRHLDNHSIAPGYGSFEFDGYTFQLPWADARRLGQVKNDSVLVSAAATVMFSDPGTISTQAIARMEPIYYRDLFSQGEFPTDYSLLWAELNSSPKDIRYFSSRRAARRNCALVQLKWVELLVDEVRTIEIIETPFVRGFEYKGRHGVLLKLFDSNGQLLKIQFLGKSSITQSEINTFIFSLRPADKNSHSKAEHD